MLHFWPHLKSQHSVINGGAEVEGAAVQDLGVEVEATEEAVEEHLRLQPQGMPTSGGPMPRGARTHHRSNRVKSTGFMGKKLTGVRSRAPVPGEITSPQEQTNEGPTSLKFPTLRTIS